MRKILFLIFCSFISSNLPAQETGNDSYTIQRLIIYNSSGEVLLERNDSGWMTPALRHNSKTSINDGLMQLASEFDLKTTRPRLAGMFIFISDYRPISQFRQHYVTKRIEGDVKVPENKLDAQWFTVSKAVEMMSLPETKAPLVIRDMTQQILYYPDIVWGGTFQLSKEGNKIRYEVKENYYPLR